MVLLQSTLLQILHRRIGLPDWAMEPGAGDTPNALDEELIAEFELYYREALVKSALCPELPYADLWSEMAGEYVSENHVTFTLPEGCVRPVSLRMAEWSDDVRVFEEADSSRHHRQRWGLLRADTEHPAVFMHADTLIVYGVVPGRKGARVYSDSFRAVIMPENGRYVLSAEMLNEIIEKIIKRGVNNG